MEFVPLLVAVGLVISLANIGKMALAGEWRNVATAFYAYLVGVGVALLLAATTFAGSIQVGDYILGELGFWDIVLFGIALSGSASTLYDALPSINTPTIGSPPE